MYNVEIQNDKTHISMVSSGRLVGIAVSPKSLQSTTPSIHLHLLGQRASTPHFGAL